MGKQPTGTGVGKSFLTMLLCRRRPGEAIWISARDHRGWRVLLSGWGYNTDVQESTPEPNSLRRTVITLPLRDPAPSKGNRSQQTRRYQRDRARFGNHVEHFPGDLGVVLKALAVLEGDVGNRREVEVLR